MIGGICFVVFVSFAHGLSDSPRHSRLERSLPDALVFAALSDSPDTPDALKYLLHPRIKATFVRERLPQQATRKPQKPTRSSQRRRPGKTPPDVEVVRSIEMEFDAVLHRLVPIKESGTRPVGRNAKAGAKAGASLSDVPLLSHKTSRDLSEILWKFEKERRSQGTGLSEAKNFQTGRFKLGAHRPAEVPPLETSPRSPRPVDLARPPGDPSWATNHLGEPEKRNVRGYLWTWEDGARSPERPRRHHFVLGA